MRIISLDLITGDELLAKEITKNNTTLMTAGNIVKQEYVHKLKDLGIDHIYVEDDIAKGVILKNSLEWQIKDLCLANIKKMLTIHDLENNIPNEEVIKIANDIINIILSNPKTIYNLYSIRENSEQIYAHSLNVCALSVIVALKLKLSKSKILDIAIGALLHDIGLCFTTINYNEINTEKCSENELKEIIRHTIYGYSAVENQSWLSKISRNMIISHHERIDGSGYPFHLKENHIKLEAKIVAVCDEFDSRVYGNLVGKMKVHEAIDFIVTHAGPGRLFDLHVVNVFIDSVAVYPTGSIVETNEGEFGIVLRQNVKFPTRPVIRILQNVEGIKVNTWLEKDLSSELTMRITDTISDYKLGNCETI